MRILLINPFSLPAGLRQANLARALARRGHEVTLVLPAFDRYSAYTPRTIPSSWNVRVIHPLQLQSRQLEVSYAPYLPSALSRLLRERFDVVHAFRPNPFSGLLGWTVARLRRAPFVLEHGDLEWETMRDLGLHPSYRVGVVRALERGLTRRADAVTVLNERVGRYVLERLRPAGPVRIVSNGVDTTAFRPHPTAKRGALRARLGADFLLMFVGKLERSEHLRDLVAVLPYLPASYGLVVVGDGAGRARLERLATQCDVQTRILFIGSIPHEEVPEHLNAADVLLAPFANERGVEHASHLKVLEYMAVGRPIVASRVGDLPSLLDGCGVLYTPGDVKEFARAICDIPPRLSVRARQRARKHDWRVLAEQLELIYGELQ